MKLLYFYILTIFNMKIVLQLFFHFLYKKNCLKKLDSPFFINLLFKKSYFSNADKAPFSIYFKNSAFFKNLFL